MKKSRTDESMLRAIDRGLRIEKDGTAIGMSGRVISGFITKARHVVGYLYTNADRIPGTNTRIKVGFHRVQAYQKFGDLMFEDGQVVRHKNGNPLDNSWDNILLGTQSQNCMDIPEDVRIRTARTAARKKRKLSDEEADELRALQAQGWTYKELTAKYGIAKSTISYIVNLKTYNYVS